MPVHGMEALAVTDALGNAVRDDPIGPAEQGGFQLLLAAILRTHGGDAGARFDLISPNQRLPGRCRGHDEVALGHQFIDTARRPDLQA